MGSDVQMALGAKYKINTCKLHRPNCCGSGRVEPNTLFVPCSLSPGSAPRMSSVRAGASLPNLTAPHNVVTVGSCPSEGISEPLTMSAVASIGLIFHSPIKLLSQQVPPVHAEVTAPVTMVQEINTNAPGPSQGLCMWALTDICTSLRAVARLESAVFPAVGSQRPSLWIPMLRRIRPKGPKSTATERLDKALFCLPLSQI